MRIIFMGTPEFAVPTLARLLEDGHEIAAVFTQPDKPAGRGKRLHAPPVKEFAASRGLTVYQPAKIKSNEEVRAIFESVAPDLCVVVAYGRILPKWMLEIPRLGCLNVHASLLPAYRGAAPINWAIAAGERRTGVSLMRMDEGLDTGPVYAMREVEIGESETAPELSARLADLGAEFLSESLPLIADGSLKPTPQDDSRASYAPILKREHGLIDWRMTAAEIAARVRAFQPWPATYTIWRGARLFFWKARVVEPGERTTRSLEPAIITRVEKNGFVVACGGSTFLLVEEAQIEGKRRQPARDLLNGARLGVGDRISDTTSEAQNESI